MFNILTGLAKTAVAVAVTPATAVADLVTLGGAITERHEPHTVSALKAAMRGIEEATGQKEE